MNNKHISTIILVVVLRFAPWAQDVSISRTRLLHLTSDTTPIDTLSLVKGSTTLIDGGGTAFADSLFRVDEARGLLIAKGLRGQFRVSYKVFPLNFAKPYRHKNPDSLLSQPGHDSLMLYQVNNTDTDADEGNNLQTNGSISRGITVGNNQDIIMNSSLNLQIQGKISDNVSLEGSISDSNIPIQPEGNSQQIQDFDKIYLKAYTDKTEVTFGDYEVQNDQGSLLKYHKKAQGVESSTRYNMGAYEVKNQGAAAISKGKYCRKTFEGGEGNQGPYRLIGCDNEMYIVVLSGTESVFVDGKLRKRGEDFDYVIDYNTAEITFTPFLPINKFSRIAVEFEYSDKNFARFLVVTNNSISSKNANTWVNIYAEQDNKNQDLQQDLNESQKRTLADAGDKPAFFGSTIADSSTDINTIRYEKIDSTVNAVLYQDILKQSTDKTRQLYTATFSFVGQGNGNYTLGQGNTNGRVFRWVAPSSPGTPAGDYEPVIVLVAPKKKQVVAVGNEWNLSRTTRSFVESAISNNDANSFSGFDDGNNTGASVKVGVEQTIPLGNKKNKLVASASQSFIDKRFDPVDKFKPVEFERDWNIGSHTKANEYLSQAGMTAKTSRGDLAYNVELLNRDNTYRGNRHTLSPDLNYRQFRLKGYASTMHSSDSSGKTAFNRYLATASKDIKLNTLGIETQQEHNLWKDKFETLTTNSTRFVSYKAFATRNDSTSWNYSASAERRLDYIIDTSTARFDELSRSIDYSAGLGLLANPNNTVKLYGHFRTLTPLRDKKQEQRERNITGRVEHQLGLLKRMLTFNTFYELGSGLENKKVYSFVEVTEGQGIYMWNDQTDYNRDGLPQLDEFELAKYKFQANYIKLFIPSNEYVSVFSNQFGEIVDIDPRKYVKPTSKVVKILTRFSSTTALKSSFKTTGKDFATNARPLLSSKPDSQMVSVSSYLKQTIFFNRSGSKFSTQYSFSNENNKMLTTNGWEALLNTAHQTFTRVDLTQQLTLSVKLETGMKQAQTEASFMENKNYHIMYTDAGPKLSFQPTPYLVFDVLYGDIRQKNSGGETSLQQTLGLENRISNNKLGRINTTVKYIHIRYNSDATSALAYLMLDGLSPGHNFTWEASFQREIGRNLQMSISYQGQKSQEIKIIHTGTMQLSAYF